MTATTYDHTNSATTNSTRVSNTDTRTTASTMGRPAIWSGRVMSGLVVTFLLLASAFPKIFLPEIAMESMRQLGFPQRHLLLLACIEVVGALLYALPRTATAGAILLTALLGGAVAAQLRIDAPTFSHTLFPVYVGALMWAGLWLRDARVRQLVPFGARD